MSPNRKWLLLPPAAALLLVLGPLSMQPTAKADPGADPQPAIDAQPRPALAPDPGQQPASDQPRPRLALPQTPDLWQIASTLVGLLLLGGAGLFVLRRLQRGSKSGSAGIVTLRQTVRLSPKQALHAIEFEGRLLLVGESDRGVTLVQAGQTGDAALDESTIAARSTVDTSSPVGPGTVGEAEGAVPKNLVIPRPDHPPRQSLPQSPRHRGPEPSGPGASVLNDFRSLLAKVER